MSISGDIGGVISGALNNNSIPTPDLSQLFETIKNAGENQRNLINALPAELQKKYQDYIASNTSTGQNLTSGAAAIGDKLKAETEANYGPEATRAALDAAKGSIYAELPGQEDAVREALAASGGFDRGTASKQLAAPALQAAKQYATAAAGITAQQLQAKQAAVQAALNKISSMNDEALQSVFGLNKEQATAILNGNRQDLKDQLAQLITQSNTETGQILGVQGDNAMNQYNQQVAENARRTAMTNGLVNLGVDAGSAANPAFLAAINAPSDETAPAGYNPNMAPGQAARLGY